MRLYEKTGQNRSAILYELCDNVVFCVTTEWIHEARHSSLALFFLSFRTYLITIGVTLCLLFLSLEEFLLSAISLPCLPHCYQYYLDLHHHPCYHHRPHPKQFSSSCQRQFCSAMWQEHQRVMTMTYTMMDLTRTIDLTL